MTGTPLGRVELFLWYGRVRYGQMRDIVISYINESCTLIVGAGGAQFSLQPKA